MKSFLIAKATLLFLTSASVLAAQINLSNITTTNAVKTNDAILVNANLGGGVWATRTATKQAVFGDPFVVTSQLADNATNRAVIVDTTATWTQGRSINVKNRGTNTFSISPMGGITSGRLAESSGPPTDDWTIYRNIAAGEGRFDLYIETTEDADENVFGYYTVFVDANAAGFGMSLIPSGENFQVDLSSGSVRLQAGIGSTSLDLNPTIGDGVAAYKLGTTLTHTAGNLMEVSNNGTNQLSVGVGAMQYLSQAADNPTNAAMIVNSASPWSGGNLLSFRNNGAEKASINYVGGVTKGTKTETIWGALPTEGEFFIGMNDVSNGDGINYVIAHGAFQTNDWSGAYSYFEIGGDTNEFLLSGVTQGESKYYEVHLGSEPDVTGGLRLTLSDIGGNLTRLSPAVASESTPYLLDTESTRTSHLLDVANNGTNQFSVTHNGRIITQGGVVSTPASAGATGTAGEIRWDASFIYVCVAANTWKRVAIATW